MFSCLSQNEPPKLLDLGSHQHSLVSQNAFISVPLLFALSWFLLRVVLPDADCETSRHGQPAQVRHHQQRRYLVNAVPGAHRAYRQAVQAQDVNQCHLQVTCTEEEGRPSPVQGQLGPVEAKRDDSFAAAAAQVFPYQVGGIAHASVQDSPSNREYFAGWTP